MQKNDKMQIGQNAKVLNINNPKYSILGVPIENQCVKGGGLLYGGFGLPIFGIFCILSGLMFCHICILYGFICWGLSLPLNTTIYCTNAVVMMKVRTILKVYC